MTVYRLSLTICQAAAKLLEDDKLFEEPAPLLTRHYHGTYKD